MSSSLRSVAVIWLGVLTTSAISDECDQLPLPSVTVKRLPEAVNLDTHYDHKAITHLAADLARPATRVLGLTRGTATVRIDARSSTYVDRTGRWECASPQLILTYGYSPMTIYIASEFPKGSCAYGEVYAHELRHVEAYQSHLVSIEKALAETLNRRFATGAPWRGPVGNAQTLIQRELDDRWVPYIKREIGKVESAQALIDTPEEYSRVAGSCSGEISRMAR